MRSLRKEEKEIWTIHLHKRGGEKQNGRIEKEELHVEGRRQDRSKARKIMATVSADLYKTTYILISRNINTSAAWCSYPNQGDEGHKGISQSNTDGWLDLRVHENNDTLCAVDESYEYLLIN
jgi:hypothetical protein